MSEQTVNMHQDLIDACRKFDRTAQVKIYELYYKAMYNTSYRILNHSAEAEDAMQEAFLEAFRKLESYRGDASFGAWLRRIVINKSLDILKKKKEFTFPEMDAFEREDEVQEQKEEEDLLKAQVTAVRKALEQLPSNYRIILSLYLVEGYDHQEIAEILDLTYSNVRVRYLRAKNKLLEEVRRHRKEYMESLNN
ncbi:MAG: RNA polymerase sigma factor [bacterium]